MKIGKEGYGFILGKDKKVVAHPEQTPGTEQKGDWVNQLYDNKKGDFQYAYEGSEKKWCLIPIH